MSRKKHVRAAFRSSVFRRDRYRCVMCDTPGFDRQGGDNHRLLHGDRADLVALDAHHITDRNLLPNGGYVLENGITLCDAGCHRLAEMFHLTGIAEPRFSPDELYLRIGSSYEKAVEASERLE